MKKSKHLYLIIFGLIVLLLSGCGERTTVYEDMAEEDPQLKPGEVLDITTLQIVAFAFDSGTEESPVTVRWEADGDFSEGFILSWDTENPAPMPGEHGWVAVDDSGTREIQVKLSQKVPHYFRICRVKDGVCDVFSETIQVVFPENAFLDDDPTDDQNEDAQVTKTIVATPTLKSTATPEATELPEAVIKIKEIDTDADGNVTVTWKLVSGSAPMGFRLCWDSSNSNPTINDESRMVDDPNVTSMSIEGFGRGYTYHFSVCQVTPEGCANYSEGVSYKVPKEETKTPTKSPYATPTYSSESIMLNTLQETGTGQVKLTWSAVGSFPKGFKVVWSKTSSTPVFPGDEYAYVNDSSARQAYVSGLTAGKTYYFRVCRYTGSACDLYSNTKSITLSSGGSGDDTITLKSITDSGAGAAKLVWTASGSFPNGFKIAYSSHNTVPVYPGDEYEYASNGSTRSIIIDNLTEGETYYFRVCKYEGGSCTVYSNMKSYLVPIVTTTKTPKPTKEPVPTATPDASSIVLNSVVDEGCGAVRVNWTPDGSFPNGFKILWSDVNNPPVFPGDPNYLESSPSATSVYLDGYTDGVTYYFRVCRFDGGGCDVYSNVVTYTVACPVPTATPTP